MSYLDNQELGFSRNGQIALPLQSADAIKNYAALKNELLKTPGIREVTAGSTYPGIANAQDMLFYAEGKTVHDVVDVHLANIDEDYMKTLGFTVLKGRVVLKGIYAPTPNNMILIEAAVKALGYDLNNAVGKKIYWDFHGVHNMMQIVGVVRNFNFESLYNTIKPFWVQRQQFPREQIRLCDHQPADKGLCRPCLKDIGRSWSKGQSRMRPLSIPSLDKDFEHNYEKDQRASGIVDHFTCASPS